MFEVGFQAYKKANTPPLQFETLSFRTLDHRMVAARVPTSGAKGQDQRRGDGRRQAVLDDMMHGATNARREGKMHTHHHENQTQTPGPFKEGDATSLYGWGWRWWY